MSNDLQGRTVAFLATDGVERAELEQPLEALSGAGARVEVLSLSSGEIDARDHDLEPSGHFAVDREVGAVDVADYDALVIPGGTVNGDKLRSDETAVTFVKDFVGSGKLVAAICHAPWVLVEAGAADGRTLTSYPSLRTDLRNAGATVVDKEVCVDGNLITSRSPEDLPAFCDAIISRLGES